jgi:hypothetical protein
MNYNTFTQIVLIIRELKYPKKYTKLVEIELAIAKVFFFLEETQ